jgi:hypothetical protein
MHNPLQQGGLGEHRASHKPPTHVCLHGLHRRSDMRTMSRKMAPDVDVAVIDERVDVHHSSRTHHTKAVNAIMHLDPRRGVVRVMLSPKAEFGARLKHPAACAPCLAGRPRIAAWMVTAAAVRLCARWRWP